MESNVDGVVLPPVSVSTVLVPVVRAEIDAKMNAYWDEVKDRLSPDVVKKATKGGYRQVMRARAVKASGGVDEFYRPVLLQVVSDWMSTQPRQALAYTQVSLVDDGATGPVVQASVHLEPVVTWKNMPGQNGQPIEVKIPKVDANLLSNIVDSELVRLQDQNSILVPTEQPLALEMVAALDCQTLIEGKVWAPGTFTNNKWVMNPEVFKLKDMLNQLLGMTVGQTKVFQSAFTEAFGPDLTGKTIDITIRVNQTFNREIPPIDDDLALTAGYKNLQDWRTNLHAKYSNTLAQERDNLIGSSLTAIFMSQDAVDLSPIPQLWLVNKAKAIYSEQRGHVRTEEDLLKRFSNVETFNGVPVTDKTLLLTFFAERAAQMLAEDLVFRDWGKMQGIAGNTQLAHLEEYASVVRKDLLTKVVVTEVEVDQTNVLAPK